MSDQITLEELSVIISQISALGLASMGLVDATKAFGGGVSNIGFRHIEKCLEPFAEPLSAALPYNGTADPKDTNKGSWRSYLRAHYKNGRPKSEQKAIAKSLIRIGLDQNQAIKMANITGINADGFLTVVKKLDSGEDITQVESNLLGRFDAIVSARLDAAYERADQSYRNGCRGWAAFFAILLAIVAQCLMQQGKPLSGVELLWALLVGFVAVPLAPISKDLLSSLSSAVTAVKRAGH